MHEIRTDEKCTVCAQSIFHRTKNNKLAMHIGVERTATGVRHHSCVYHAEQEAKRLAKLAKKSA